MVSNQHVALINQGKFTIRKEVLGHLFMHKEKTFILLLLEKLSE